MCRGQGVGGTAPDQQSQGHGDTEKLGAVTSAAKSLHSSRSTHWPFLCPHSGLHTTRSVQELSIEPAGLSKSSEHAWSQTVK